MILVNCQWKETGTTATPRTTVTSSAVSLTPFGRLAWSDLLTQVSQKLTFTLFCLSENVSHYNKKCWKCCGTSDQVNTRPFVKMILVNCLWNDTVTIACNCDLIWRLSTRNSIWLACLIWFIDSDQPRNWPSEEGSIWAGLSSAAPLSAANARISVGNSETLASSPGNGKWEAHYANGTCRDFNE